MDPTELRERLQALWIVLKCGDVIETEDIVCVGFTYIEFAQMEQWLDAIISALEPEPPDSGHNHTGWSMDEVAECDVCNPKPDSEDMERRRRK